MGIWDREQYSHEAVSYCFLNQKVSSSLQIFQLFLGEGRGGSKAMERTSSFLVQFLSATLAYIQ